MAIVGLGTDIVEIARIDAAIQRSPRLVERVLTPHEQAIFASSQQPVRYFAKRFAAKEAAAKALGTGIGRGVSFQHIDVSNNDFGAPVITLNGGATARLKQIGGMQLFLSIADEQHYVTATVVIE
ncbi:holo-ACP synthase [Shewanella gelidii]|uniref:Holo-[acyl-carrier-protein] synthase n=1 Tax=Shewanella gelidii TaxID=1642821 RepID=A0A917JHN2_9GAMM|nr:holo-ACP synthase [Shewanella gelidii]MCL1096664.1 holo-ACP synthase [Shewanella gelidii]GGI69347.1 holo-[acyl-carrier-protein] synthase [Shewanella gelidii]